MAHLERLMNQVLDLETMRADKRAELVIIDRQLLAARLELKRAVDQVITESEGDHFAATVMETFGPEVATVTA